MDSFNSHIDDIIEQSKNRVLQNGWQGLVEEQIQDEARQGYDNESVKPDNA